MASVPLAGRPPFDIDDSNVIYSTPVPTRRIQQKPPPERPTSAYNAYDSYLEPTMDAKHTHSRNDSAAGAIGGGLLNFRDSYVSDADSDISPPTNVPKSKNQALFEAAVTSNSAPPPPAYQASSTVVPPPEKNPIMSVVNPGPATTGSSRQQYPPQQQGYHRQQPGMQQNRGPSPAPPAAPVNVQIHQQAAPQPQRPSPAFMPPGGIPTQGPPGPRGNIPPPLNFDQQQRPRPSPGPYGMSMTPHAIPLPPSSTPIQPVFIKPAFIKFEENLNASKDNGSMLSHESTMPIMRSDKEETLLSRTTGSGPRLPRVGEKRDGDDFWRRFSMVAKSEKAKPADQRSSPWLRSTLNRGASLSRWVWFIGIVSLIIVVGGCVAIWWFTRGNPDHQIPLAIGGGASQAMTYSSTDAPAASGTTAAKVDRPLITGTAVFGTKAKREPTPVAQVDVAAAILQKLNILPTQTPVPIPDGGFKLHRRKTNRFS